MKSLRQTFSNFLSTSQKEILLDIGLLLLRVSVAGMMLFCHGWGKLVNFADKSSTFPDPLGIGSPLSMALAVGAEVFCAAAVIVGFATRFAAVPLVITMLVAAFIVHADDPWRTKEFPLMYLLPFLALIFTGAGRFSVDGILFRRNQS